MATATGRICCVTCGKERSTFKCGGCSQEFCFKHLTDHKLELSAQLDHIEVNRDLFWQTLTEHTSEPQNHALIQQIDEWERDSIQTIQHTAEEARQAVLKYTTGHIKELETKLNKLTDQLRRSREENDFFETDLRRWNEDLTRLAEELAIPSSINLQRESAPLVTKISIAVTSITSGNVCVTESAQTLRISPTAIWIQNGFTVAGGHSRGNELNQLSKPWGLYVDEDRTIYVADCGNCRLIEWKSDATSGRIVAGGRGKGSRNDQLGGTTDVIVDKKNDCFIISDYGNRRVVRWSRQNSTSGEVIISNIACWGLAIDKDGYLYVSDYDKGEVRRWRVGDSSGTVVAGGNGKGDRLDQLSSRLYIFVDEDQSVYVSDEGNHRVVKWIKGAKEGIVVAGGRGSGSSLAQLSYPNGIAVDQSGTVYVADSNNHRIMRWPKGAQEGSIVAGENGQGAQANQLATPSGLRLDQHGNLYVIDNENSRVQRFDIDPNSNV